MRLALAAYLAAVMLLAALAVAGGVALFRETGPSDAVEAAADEHGYSLVTWELQHFPQKWVHELRHLFDDRSRPQEDDTLRQYFSLTDEIRRSQEGGAASIELIGARSQRAAIEDEVEEIIEGRVTAVLEDQGLALRPPLFSDLGLIFPPLRFELDAPP